MSEKLWKRVGDYPPPEGVPLLIRHPMTGPSVRYSNVYMLPDAKNNLAHLDSNAQWCEVDTPTEVAPPPVDELDAEADTLRKAYYPGQYLRTWGEIPSGERENWRKVARQARELHTNPWRPMSELEDNHQRRVLIKRKKGAVVILGGTARSSDAAYSRESWKEID